MSKRGFARVTAAVTVIGVLALPHAALAITPANGHYAGRGRPVTHGISNWSGFSFDVHGGVVQGGFWEGNGTGGCGYAADFQNTSTLESDGSFELDFNDSGQVAGSLVGRFVSKTQVRGKFLLTDTTSCPQTQTRFKIALSHFGKKAPGGGVSTVRDGHYAGAGKNFDVWFDLKNSVLQNTAYVRMQHAGSCDIAGGGFSTPTVSPKGRFTANRSDGNGTSTLRGRFFSPSALAGSLAYDATIPCPPGTYNFSYTGKRFGIPG